MFIHLLTLSIKYFVVYLYAILFQYDLLALVFKDNKRAIRHDNILEYAKTLKSLMPTCKFVLDFHRQNVNSL